MAHPVRQETNVDLTPVRCVTELGMWGRVPGRIGKRNVRIPTDVRRYYASVPGHHPEIHWLCS